MADIEQRARELLAAEYGCHESEITETEVRAASAALASQAQVQVPEDVRRAGAMLSNCAYNLAQRQHLTEAERRSLDESRRAWDAAIAAAPAPQKLLPQETPSAPEGGSHG